jgi:hypothetical protein
MRETINYILWRRVQSGWRDVLGFIVHAASEIVVVAVPLCML